MKDRLYFPGLNGLRFLAALSVVVGHIEQFKGFLGLMNRPGAITFFLNSIVLDGRDAVTLFFVLSGFLITYLLLAEQQKTGTIAVRKFYVRRILRIWPLYYLILFISFIIIPLVYHLTQFHGWYVTLSQDFFLKVGLMFFFVPNIADLMNIYVVGAMHLWSIGIEEQFYLIWPALLKKVGKYTLACLLGLIAFKAVFIYINYRFGDNIFPPSVAFLHPVFIFIINFRIESMAVGGLGAYILFTRREWLLKIIFNPVVEKVILLLMILNAVVLRSTGLAIDLALSVVYALFILNVSSNPRSTVKLENRFFNAVGKFSYGIYMFHPAIIYMLLIGFDKVGFTDTSNPIYNVILYALVISLTIGVSALSYRFFEMPFLRLKNRLAVVQSGDAPVPEGKSWLESLLFRLGLQRKAPAPATELE